MNMEEEAQWIASQMTRPDVYTRAELNAALDGVRATVTDEVTEDVLRKILAWMKDSVRRARAEADGEEEADLIESIIGDIQDGEWRRPIGVQEVVKAEGSDVPPAAAAEPPGEGGGVTAPLSSALADRVPTSASLGTSVPNASAAPSDDAYRRDMQLAEDWLNTSMDEDAIGHVKWPEAPQALRRLLESVRRSGWLDAMRHVQQYGQTKPATDRPSQEVPPRIAMGLRALANRAQLAKEGKSRSGMPMFEDVILTVRGLLGRETATTRKETTTNEQTEDSGERDEEARHRRGGLPGDRVESPREPTGVRAVGVADEGGGGGPRSQPDGSDAGGDRERGVTATAAGPSGSAADSSGYDAPVVQTAHTKALIEQVRRETVEACAKVAEAYAGRHFDQIGDDPESWHGHRACAARIVAGKIQALLKGGGS